LHPRGHFVLLLGVGLEFFRCWDVNIGGGIALGLIVSQSLPTDAIALTFSAGFMGTFTVWSFIQGNWWHCGFALFLFLVTAVSLVSLVVPNIAVVPAVLPQVITPSAPPMQDLMVWPRMRPAMFKKN